MSVRTLSRVWENSQHAGTDLLMLLAIADFADDEGNAYPAVPTLAKKCRMSPRNANFILAALKASGELEVRANEGPKGTNRYRIVLGLQALPLKPTSPPKPPRPLKSVSSPAPSQPLKPASSPGTEAHFTPEAAFTLKPTSATPEAGFLEPLKPTSDEPSLNRQEPSRKARKRAASGQTFSEWFKDEKRDGQALFETTDPVYVDQQKVGLPIEFVRLAWDVFKADHEKSDKRQADWRATFRNYVSKGWLRLWYFDKASGQPTLTTAGVQAARLHDRAELAVAA